MVSSLEISLCLLVLLADIHSCLKPSEKDAMINTHEATLFVGKTRQRRDEIRFTMIYNEFKASHFKVQKTKRAFSAIPLDQAHEQNNARVKGDRGAVGLTDNPSALRLWMVAGPEVARVIMEFEEANMHPNANEETRHHEETPCAQEAFAEDVQSLVAVIEELGNPFEEDSPDLLVRDTKKIADLAVIETVRTAKQIGQEQFQAYSTDCLIDRTKTI
uniref:Uncharacterized protein n=1 Tax=Eptatretus burgeri TaxID=7764 RepID=A0A8C4QRU2_EPTBU